MKKDKKIYLEHILKSINCIEDYVGGVTEDNFYSSVQTQDAVIWRLEIIGSSFNGLLKNFSNVQIHGRGENVINMGNFLIQECFNIDKKKIWAVIKKDLPELKKEITLLLK